MNDNNMVYELHPWRIEESSFNGEQIARSEAIFTLANGFVGLRGSYEEKRSVSAPGTYINGFYEIFPIAYGEWAYGYPQTKQRMVPVPDCSGITVTVDGEPLDLSQGKVLEYNRHLDLKTGILHRTVRWQAPCGKKVELETSRIVSFEKKNSVLLRWECTLLDDAQIEITSDLDGEIAQAPQENDPRIGEAISKEIYCPQQSTWEDGIGILTLSTRKSRLAVAAALSHHVETQLSYREEQNANPFALRKTYTMEGIEGATFCLQKYISYCTSLDYPSGSIEEVAKEELLSAAARGFEELSRAQADSFSSFWKTADIILEGDQSLQQSLRYNLFQILQAAGTDGKTGVPAKGLSGEGYEGHYFWDTEIYLMPFFTYIRPDIAKQLLRYRYRILPRARQRARELSHRGALYPWRTINGDECSAYYPAGTAQYHINSDIIFSMKRLWEVSGDHSLLVGMGAEMLFETARFWIDLGTYIEGKGFCLNEVTGPDEYTALVNNNTYTNVMAAEHLRFAAELARTLQLDYAGEYAKLEEKLRISQEEIEAWQQASQQMYIPFDRKSGVYPQDDSFFEKAPWDFQNTPQDHYPLLLHYHPLNIYRHQVLKQPDLLLAMHLLHDRFTNAERKRNFEFYNPLTTGDSSLSPCIQSVTAANFGDTELAYHYFMKTARMDLDDINKNVKHGLHLAAMGGTWVSLIYGFAGLQDSDGRIRFFPRLPSEWQRFCFRLIVQEDHLLQVDIGTKAVTYSLLEGADLTIEHEYETVELLPEQPVTKSLEPELKAVIFDLDGVITDTAEYHYQAWKRLADELEIPFDRDFNQKLRGVGRVESLKLILSQTNRQYSEEEIFELAQRKNSYYQELIEQITPADLLPGVQELLKDLRGRRIKCGLASASRNAPRVIEKLEAGHMFDYFAQASNIVVGKPDPEIFLTAASGLGVVPKNCAGVEDAQAGIEAINAAGMFSVGVGEYLEDADWKVSTPSEITCTTLLQKFGDSSKS
jgi:alpha,alpha-trehalose phosphorylase